MRTAMEVSSTSLDGSADTEADAVSGVRRAGEGRCRRAGEWGAAAGGGPVEAPSIGVREWQETAGGEGGPEEELLRDLHRRN
jgi:hypothetical protein